MNPVGGSVTRSRSYQVGIRLALSHAKDMGVGGAYSPLMKYCAFLSQNTSSLHGYYRLREVLLGLHSSVAQCFFFLFLCLFLSDAGKRLSIFSLILRDFSLFVL